VVVNLLSNPPKECIGFCLFFSVVVGQGLLIVEDS
jgi:hypothetical protein